MINIAIAISFLVTFAGAESECWSEKFGYKCCEPGIKVETVSDEGSWGKMDGNWCGIKEYDPNERCWASYLGYSCCLDDEGEVKNVDMDGDWGYENGKWCGFKNSTARWNDREKFEDTKKEWKEFKNKWEEYSKNFERLSVFAGEDESKLNFGWYSTTNNEPIISLGTKEDMSDAKEFKGINVYYKDMLGKKYYSNKVTVTGLSRNSVYYYKRKLNDFWEDPIQFTTRDPDNFNFIFYGDPQIGGSKNRLSVANLTQPLTVLEGTRNDAFNWNMTIMKSFELTGGPSLIMTAGDQADSECTDNKEESFVNQEIQFNAFLLPELLKTVPMAAALGNHEQNTDNFRNHFNAPNALTKPHYINDNYEGPIPAYNYFFKYNNVLVVVLETNKSNCDDFKTIISSAIDKHPNTDWRIAMFHHDIYGNGYIHSEEKYITDTLRPCLTEFFSKHKFDLVINGHDHVYTATHFVSFDGNSSVNSSTSYYTEEIQSSKIYNNTLGTQGTLYITANCATGSKLYTFHSHVPDYVYHFNQTFTSTFGVLDFQRNNDTVGLKITYYEVDTLDVKDGPYIFEKMINSNNNTNIGATYVYDESGPKIWLILFIVLIVLIIVFLLVYRSYLKKKNNDSLGRLLRVTSRTHLGNNSPNNSRYM